MTGPCLPLFTIPFAGGAAYSYGRLAASFGPEVKLVPLELPGRGRRIREPLLDDIEAMADDLMEQIVAADVAAFGLFGHSMGAHLALLVCQRLRAAGQTLPRHVFFSGRGGPRYDGPMSRLSELSSDALFESLVALGGLPVEILAEPAARDFFEPVIRADVHALESSRYLTKARLAIPATVFYGSRDTVSRHAAELWGEELSIPPRIVQIEGHHFFFNERSEEVAGIVQETLAGLIVA